ncbi:ribonuclease J [Sulfurospirillum sp. DNRA8]|uniref:ribonuclease J n=2 Tax=Sulfurospirillum sp. hDNRA2 TaxID=3237298 RepID=UPI0020B86732|nr:ribonuclease J [Sulfurospirillum sp. DNRA8]MCP3652460.1 ribonuclease J [Sulfurospirillum sp. DNRA8]MCR1811311.1 ribonuclease J [Sulfurospirillum sp. DNRA8]
MMQENEIPSTNNEQSNAATPPKPNKNRRRRSKPKAAPMHSGEDQTAVEQTDNGTAQPNAGENKPKTNNRRRNKAKTQTPSIDGNEPWQRDIKKAIDANQKMHKERLNKASVVEQNSKGKIKITPLGGLGEIGGNICVFETDTSAIVLDVGMSFPSEDMHGVDILVPDFSYLRQIKKKIAGIIISHAHEDHIGAISYLFKEMQFPLYATPLPLGMISNKFDEHGLKAYKKYFRPVEKRKLYKIGEFEIEWIHITHSIIDASALAITTEAGTIIHTGDFKIDHTPIDGYVTDLNRFAAYGEKGVLCLMSDSTNSYKEGITRSESTVGKTFDSIFAKSKGRVIMSTFSSNIHRVYQAIDYGLKYGRKVCVIGRSMERNLFTAIDLGYIQLDKSIFIDPHEVNKHNDKDVLIVTTGSQGETMSALYRMATDEHRHVKIKPTDQIIISAKAIPGNEGSVSKVLNFLLKSGANVAYQDFSEIHVSGHAAQEEQKLILRLVKPKFFLPVHGEYNHITKHKETAMQCGIPERNIYLMSDGDQVELCGKYMKKIKTIKTGKVFIDNQVNEQIADDVVIDRQKLAEAGLVMLVIQIDKSEHKLIAKPKIISYGLVPDKDDKAFSIEMEGVIDQFIANAKKELLENARALENEVRQVVRKHIYRQMKKYPTIVPTIFMM